MSIRDQEGASIRAFLQEHSGVFEGADVLDFGCGRQQYRPIIEAAGGRYHGYDRVDFPGNISGEDIGAADTTNYNVIVCTQVIQYVPDALGLLAEFHALLSVGGTLLMTGPTTWPEVEKEDIHRFTRAGIERLALSAGFGPVTVEERLRLDIDPMFKLLIGWQLEASW